MANFVQETNRYLLTMSLPSGSPTIMERLDGTAARQRIKDAQEMPMRKLPQARGYDPQGRRVKRRTLEGTTEKWGCIRVMLLHNAARAHDHQYLLIRYHPPRGFDASVFVLRPCLSYYIFFFLFSPSLFFYTYRAHIAAMSMGAVMVSSGAGLWATSRKPNVGMCAAAVTAGVCHALAGFMIG